jgi:flagellar motor switch protein FliN/FliY
MQEIDENKEVSNKDTAEINEDQKVENQIDFSNLNDKKVSKTGSNINFLLDIPLEITIELGRTKMLINELLKLGQGSVIELEKPAGETMDIFANQRLIAKGEVVVINEKYGVRLTEIISPMERIVRLK